MPRDALVDGHGRRAVGLDLRVLRAQEAQTICRRTARQVCCERCAAEVGVGIRGHTQHRIICGHACRHVECEFLETPNALRCDVFRLTHDECVVRAHHTCRSGIAAVQLRPREIGGARDLNDVAAHDCRRMRSGIRPRTPAVDGTHVGAAAQIHLIALCCGNCCAARRLCVAVTAEDILFEGSAVQRDDIPARDSLCLGVECICICIAAADLLPWGTHGAECDAVRVCRRCDRAQLTRCTCISARDIASVAVGARRDGDRVLLCRCGCASRRTLCVGSTAGEIADDCTRPILDRDAVALREGGRRIRACIRRAVARCHARRYACACQRNLIALNEGLCRAVQGVGIGPSRKRSIHERAARCRDLVVRGTDANISRPVRRERGACGSHVICRAAIVDGHRIPVHLSGKGRSIQCANLFNGRAVQIAVLRAVRSDHDGVLVRRVGDGTAVRTRHMDASAKDMRERALGQRDAVAVCCERRYGRCRRIRRARIDHTAAANVGHVKVSAVHLNGIAARRRLAVPVRMGQIEVAAVHPPCLYVIRDCQLMIVIGNRCRICRRTPERQTCCDQCTEASARVFSVAPHKIDSFR